MKDDFELEEEKESGRKNYFSLLKRRRWYLLAPLLLLGLIGSIVANVWPLQYRSEALILVEQQKVPEQYVTPNVITSLQNRLDGMTQQILSRTRLERLIEDFKLYPKQRARVTMDEIVDMMRKNITVQLVQTPGQAGGVTGFRISYSGEGARITQRVTNELTSLFIDQSLRERTQQSNSTTQFLENELDEAQKDLAIQEGRLREYKMQFIGELPEQQQGNLQILSSLEAQLYAGESALQRAEQQKAYLEAMKSEYQALSELRIADDGSVIASVKAETNPSLRQIETSLLDLQRQLSAARSMYTSQHPAILELEAQMTDLKKQKREIEAEEKAAADKAKESAPGQKVRNVQDERLASNRMNLAELESRLKAVVMEIGNDQKDVSDLRNQIQEARKRVSMTPVREQQLSGITRTHANSQAHYQSLLQKKLQSELASNLEKRQGGEQFRILDPASLPVKPEGRLRILGFGWLAGICLGFGLVVVREFTGQRVNDEEDIRAASSLPVFQIPVIRSPREYYRRRVWIVVEATTAFLLAVAALAASARTYLMG
jgi:succinoglycan biosynthesis transport protein ExoP